MSATRRWKFARFLAQTTIRLNDLMTLQVGDLITTDKECTEDVLIQVEGKKKFLAQVGQFRGQAGDSKIDARFSGRRKVPATEKPSSGATPTGAAAMSRAAPTADAAIASAGKWIIELSQAIGIAAAQPGISSAGDGAV